MRRPIVIEALGQARDAHGGMVKTWTVHASLRAKIVNKSGNEQGATGSGGATGVARTEFTTRFVPGVNTSMRVAYAGNHYNILHVNNFLEEDRFLILTCDTGLSNG